MGSRVLGLAAVSRVRRSWGHLDWQERIGFMVEGVLRELTPLEELRRQRLEGRFRRRLRAAGFSRRGRRLRSPGLVLLRRPRG